MKRRFWVCYCMKCFATVSVISGHLTSSLDIKKELRACKCNLKTENDSWTMIWNDHVVYLDNTDEDFKKDRFESIIEGMK